MNPLTQIVYVSSASQPFSSGDLGALLSKARDRNEVYQITGLLLYHRGLFVQVLEGHPNSVALILGAIEQDPRHHGLRILSRRAIAAREFSDWSMGFIDSSGVTSRLAGFVEHTRLFDSLGSSATPARRLLRFFLEGLYRQHLGHDFLAAKRREVCTTLAASGILIQA